MTTTDRIIRATGKRTPMRLVLADITHTMNQIGAKHKASAYSLKLLAETAVGSLLLSSSLKFPGTVSLKISFRIMLLSILCRITIIISLRLTFLQQTLILRKIFLLMMS